MNKLDEIIYSSRLLVIIDQLLDYEKIYIWGAGKMGNYIYDSLVLSGIEDRFSGFVTTSSPEFLVGKEFFKREFNEKTALVVATDYYRDVFSEISAHFPISDNLVIWDGRHYFLDSHYLVDQEVKNFIVYLDKIGFSYSVSVDVGGNIGKYTSLLGFLGEQVHSFEPNPKTSEVLKLRTKYIENKTVINVCGVGENSGILTFYNDIHTKESTSSTFDKSIVMNWKPDQYEEIKVPIVSLDQYCMERNIHPTFIKIDAEGLDYEVMFGAEKIIKSSNSIIVFENSLPILKDSRSQYSKFLNLYGDLFLLLNLIDISIVENWEILMEKPSVKENIPYNYAIVPIQFSYMFSG